MMGDQDTISYGHLVFQTGNLAFQMGNFAFQTDYLLIHLVHDINDGVLETFRLLLSLPFLVFEMNEVIVWEQRIRGHK